MSDYGMIDWGVSRDEDAHREYFVNWLVHLDDVLDGPGSALYYPLLPRVGDRWAFGNYADPWAFCHPDAEVKRLYDDREPSSYFNVKQKFSTRPIKWCDNIEDPFLQPAEISGSYVKKTEEAAYDRHKSVKFPLGHPILTKSFERIKGEEVKFDEVYPTVVISWNVPILGLDTIDSFVNKVNSEPIWGLAPRCVKLSDVAWTRKLHATCFFYYTRTFTFEINKNTFDRDVPSYGNKCLDPSLTYTFTSAGGGTFTSFDGLNCDPTIPVTTTNEDGSCIKYYQNPKRFVQYKDSDGENAKTFHDQYGRAVSTEEEIAKIHIEKYEEDDFSLLGVPLSF